MELSENLSNVYSDIRGDIYKRALQMEKAGEKVLKLNTGNPAAFGFNMPESIKNKVIKSFDTALGYCHIQGMEEAREAIKDYHLRLGVRDITEDDVFIGNGVSEVASMVISALVGPSDEVLVPSPCYSLWTNFTHLSGGKSVFYSCREEDNWQPDTESIKRQISKKTKAIVLINPNNPTGVMYSKEVLEEIVDIARKNNLVIISDEIYDRLILDEKEHIPTATLSDDVVVVTTNGLSKSHCICGLRCGWAVISGDRKERKKLCEALVRIASIRLCPNTLMQLAIKDALKDEGYTREMIKEKGRLREQRDACVSELSKISGISFVKNHAAFYIFPRLDIKRFGFESDRDFAKRLLEEKKILIVPGSGFSAEDNEHFRIVMLPKKDELTNAVAGMADFLKKHII